MEEFMDPSFPKITTIDIVESLLPHTRELIEVDSFFQTGSASEILKTFEKVQRGIVSGVEKIVFYYNPDYSKGGEVAEIHIQNWVDSVQEKYPVNAHVDIKKLTEESYLLGGTIKDGVMNVVIEDH